MSLELRFYILLLRLELDCALLSFGIDPIFVLLPGIRVDSATEFEVAPAAPNMLLYAWLKPVKFEDVSRS